MEIELPSSWRTVLDTELTKPYFQKLWAFVEAEQREHTVYPPKPLIFNAFHHCHWEAVKVVILGQDPYHGEGQANGLCFSVNDGIKSPPSLVNIFREVHADLGAPIPATGNLERWAGQGVLLLNAVLTVRAKKAASHSKKGWETFTDAVIERLNAEKNHLVFLLWGRYAQNKGTIIDTSRHCVLQAPHPSPMSRQKFAGNKPFSQANAYLSAHGRTPIEW